MDQFAPNRVDGSQVRVEVRLRRQQEDDPHQHERWSPRIEAAEQRHGHTVESDGVLVITSKSPYAVRALAELARRGGGTPVPIGEIARARDIPVQFLEA